MSDHLDLFPGEIAPHDSPRYHEGKRRNRTLEESNEPVKDPDVATVRKAMQTIQDVLKTTYEFDVKATDEATHTLYVTRGDRGDEDPKHFELRFNATRMADRLWTRHTLLSSCLHELLHAISWPLYDLGPHRLHTDEKERYDASTEAVVYELERLFWPLVKKSIRK